MPPLPPIRETVRSAATGVSWLALVAATSLGVAEVDHIRASVSGADLADELANGVGEYRLIVQTYDAERVTGPLPHAGVRPVASTQRAVTAEELRRGVEVDVVSLGDAAGNQLAVAWVERGAPDLEFDGLRAVPPPNARSSAVHGQAARLVLG